MRWLLDSDPSIRWQVMRDLTDEPDEVITAEQALVASEGWGAQLLDLQTPDGHWGGDDRARAWMTTIYTLLLLKNLGVDPSGRQVRKAIGLRGLAGDRNVRRRIAPKSVSQHCSALRSAAAHSSVRSSAGRRFGRFRNDDGSKGIALSA
jgi:hypothetical protein